MNLSMKIKAVNNQLKLFDENSYPDPNPLRVGDLIGYDKWTDIIIMKNNDIIVLKIHGASPKLVWKDVKVIKKYFPEKDIFEPGQKVWWNGAYPSHTMESCEIHYDKTKPGWVSIREKYFDSVVGFIYILIKYINTESYYYAYPEDVYKEEQK